MSRVAIVLLAPTVLAQACNPKGSARFEGRWRGLRAEGVTSEAISAADAFAAGTELDVQGVDMTLVTPRSRQTGRYKVVTEDKATLVITTDKDGPDEPQVFTFVDGKTMTWAVLEGKSIVFAKQ